MMIFTEGQSVPAIFLILLGTGFSIITRKLTFFGAFTGALIASIIYFFGGYTALIMLTAFFITGTFATSWRKKEKQNIINAARHQEKRNTNQVLANAAIPALVAILIYLNPGHTALYQLMIAGSLASATADTWSSELGMIYGRRFYNVLSLKSDAKGLDGVVSLEGTLIGFAGAAFIACIYALGYGWNGGFWIVILSGIAGNLIDSMLGAAFERKGLLTNDLVNFLNTASAAFIACLVWYITY